MNSLAYELLAHSRSVFVPGRSRLSILAMNINAEFEQFTAEMNLDADIAPELYREIVLPAGDRCSPIGHSGTQVVKPLRSGSCLLNESNAIGPATPVPRMFHVEHPT